MGENNIQDLAALGIPDTVEFMGEKYESWISVSPARECPVCGKEEYNFKKDDKVGVVCLQCWKGLQKKCPICGKKLGEWGYRLNTETICSSCICWVERLIFI